MRAPRTRGGAPMSTSELYPGVGVCLVVKGNVKLESLLGSWRITREVDDFGRCENVSRWTDRRNYSTESIAGELSHLFAEGTHLGAGMLKFWLARVIAEPRIRRLPQETGDSNPEGCGGRAR